jgi:hypothetical protein
LHAGRYGWASEELALGGLLQPRQSSSSSKSDGTRNGESSCTAPVPAGGGTIHGKAVSEGVLAAAAGGAGMALAVAGVGNGGQRGASGTSSSSGGVIRSGTGQGSLGGSYALVFTAWGLQPGYVMVALPEVAGSTGAKPPTVIGAAGGKVGTGSTATNTIRLNK